MSNVHNGRFQSPNGGRDIGIRFETMMPRSENKGTINDSSGYLYSPGYTESLELTKTVAQELADQLGEPVSTYDHVGVRHVGKNVRRDMPKVYRDGFLYAADMLEARFGNTDALNAIPFSIGGMAVSFAAELEPERFETIQYVKSAGTVGGARHHAENVESLQDQIDGLTNEELEANGRILLKRFIGARQIRDIVPHITALNLDGFRMLGGAIRETDRMLGRSSPSRVMRVFGVPSTLDVRNLAVDLRQTVAIGVAAGEGDQLFGADEAQSAMSGPDGAHRFDRLPTPHVPLVGEQGKRDIAIIAGSVRYLRELRRSERLSQPTEEFDHTRDQQSAA